MRKLIKETLRKIGEWIRGHSNILKLIFIFSILLFVINRMTNILQGMTYSELKLILSAQKKSKLLLMTGIGLVAVLPMLLYDWVTVTILEENGKPRLDRKRLFTSAWTTNTINNLVGFGGVIGATLRAKFYGEEVETIKVVTTVSKVAIFVLSGLSLLSLMTFIDIFFIRPDNPYGHYWIWLLGGSLITPALFIFVRLKRRTLFVDFSLKRVFQLILGSFGQWSGALATFLLVGKLLEVPVKSTEIYPLFVAATLIGMMSMVPGGMGTFDMLMIIGLGQVGLSKEMAVAWLLYYRVFYYISPFLTGVFSYLHQTSAEMNAFFDGMPRVLVQKAAHYILVCMVYFAGVTMVLLSTVPNLSNLSSLFQKVLPYSFNFLNQTLNMLVGFLLLGLARGVANQVQKAYLPTLGILAFCIINSIFRTFPWPLLIFYVFLIACLLMAKKEFFRKQLIFSWKSLCFDGTLFGLLFILYSVVGYYSSGRISHGEAPASFLLFPSETIWLEGLAGLILAAITLFVLYHYLGPTERPGLYFDKVRIESILSKYPNTAYSHLIYLKDKRQYFFQVNGHDNVMFTFELQGSKLFVLGEPVGDERHLKEASIAFMSYADRLGYQLIFYGIDSKYSLLLHDLGFDFLKIGEEGRVDLEESSETQPAFTTETLHAKQLEAQGYRFQLYSPPFSEELISEIEKVSDEWVKRFGDKYFTVGRFKREYLNQSSLGVVYSKKREVIAYINMKPIKGTKSVSYDMLRFKGNVPEKIENYLLGHLIAASKEQGNSVFSIGLVPLSKVGEADTAFMNERVIHAFYKYSNPSHNYKDVRELKEGFATEWRPKYVSYQKGNSIIFLIARLYLLVERGKRLLPRPVEEVMLRKS